MDITRETYLEAIKSLDSLRNTDSVIPWIMQISANKAKKYLKKENAPGILATEERQEVFDELTPDPNENLLPENIADNACVRGAIMEMVDTLPEAQRESVLMFYFSKMSVESIAKVQDCSKVTVKSHLNYAPQKLKDNVLEFEKTEGDSLHSLVPITVLFESAVNSMPELTSILGNATEIVGDVAGLEDVYAATDWLTQR